MICYCLYKRIISFLHISQTINTLSQKFIYQTLFSFKRKLCILTFPLLFTESISALKINCTISDASLEIVKDYVKIKGVNPLIKFYMNPLAYIFYPHIDDTDFFKGKHVENQLHEKCCWSDGLIPFALSQAS